MLNLTISIGYITLIIILVVILFGGRLFIGFGKDNMTTQEKQMREDIEYLVRELYACCSYFSEYTVDKKVEEIKERYNIQPF